MISNRFIFVVLVLALGTAGSIGVARLHRTANKMSPIAAPVPLLDRRVASIQLVAVPAKDAFTKAQSVLGVRIAPDWTSLIAHHVDPKHRLSLDLKDTTVGDVMEGLTEQLRSYTAAAGYTVEGDTIVVAPDNCLKRALVIYDIQDLNLAAAASRKHYDDDLLIAVSFALEPQYWNCGVLLNEESEWLHHDAIRLMVLQTPERHEKIRGLLRALRHATRDGTGPAMTRMRATSRLSGRTTLRVYDVSDLAGGFRYDPPKIGNSHGGGSDPYDRKPSAGTLGIGNFLSMNVIANSWIYSGHGIGQFCVFEDQLIIEQVPEVHEEIRRMLADLRARHPTPFAGVSLTN